MFDSYWPILVVLAIPYCYIVARAASIGYFHEKLRYHINIMSTMEEPDGKRQRS